MTMGDQIKGEFYYEIIIYHYPQESVKRICLLKNVEKRCPTRKKGTFSPF
jgi:hypothetical protein